MGLSTYYRVYADPKKDCITVDNLDCSPTVTKEYPSFDSLPKNIRESISVLSLNEGEKIEGLGYKLADNLFYIVSP